MLNNQLNFTTYINKKFKIMQVAKIQIKELTEMQSLALSLIKKIYLVVAQFVFLYKVELW